MQDHPIVFEGTHRIGMSNLGMRDDSNLWRSDCLCGWTSKVAGIARAAQLATIHLEVMAGCSATVDRADGA